MYQNMWHVFYGFNMQNLAPSTLHYTCTLYSSLIHITNLVITDVVTTREGGIVHLLQHDKVVKTTLINMPSNSMPHSNQHCVWSSF